MTTTTRLVRFAASGLAGLAIALTLGCSAAPRQRPVKMGDVDTGAGSLEAVRRQLEGSWQLASLQTFGGGAPVTHPAEAVLTYDAYGNLSIIGRLEKPDPNNAGSPLLQYKGRAVIDPAKQQLRLMDSKGPEGALPTEVRPEHLRKYEFAGEQLKLSTIDASGNVTATTVWNKRAR